jgi:hypothetical protein
MTTDELLRSVARNIGEECAGTALAAARDSFRSMLRMELEGSWRRWAGLEAHKCGWRAIAREARRELQRLRSLREPLIPKKAPPPSQGSASGYTASDGTSPGQPGASPTGEGQGPGDTASSKADNL